MGLGRLMRRHGRVVSILLAVALVTVLVAGCSGSSSPPAGGTPAGSPEKSAAPAPALEKVIQWKVQAADVAGTARFELLKYFTKAVEEASKGRMKMELYPADTLYPTFQSVDAVKNGVTEAAVTWGDYSSGKEPMMKLLTYRPCDPFKSLVEANYLLTQTEGLIAEAYSKLGVSYAGSLLAVPGEAFHSNAPIKSLADFKGLKVRSSGLGQELFQELGAAVVTMPMTEVYTAVKLNTLQAFESGGYADNWQSGFQEVVKYSIEPTLHAPSALMGGHLIVNNEAWRQLPDDLKLLIKHLCGSSRLHTWTELTVLDGEAKLKFESKGVKTLALPQADADQARKIGAKVVAKYRTQSELAGKYIATYRDVLTKLGYADLAKELE